MLFVKTVRLSPGYVLKAIIERRKHMNQAVNIQGYLDTVDMPWGKLFYHMIWHNLNCENKKILDFGSGFGITANYLAEKNEVTAIEPNEEMLP